MNCADLECWSEWTKWRKALADSGLLGICGARGHDPNLMEARMSGTGKSKRGFASMDANRQKEIASKGGRAAHAKGTAHEWTSDEARVAGRKGGEVVSRDRAHMAAIGREGGESRGARNRGRQSSGRGSEASSSSGASYSDRESPVEVSREGMSRDQGNGARSGRDEGEESIREEDSATSR